MPCWIDDDIDVAEANRRFLGRPTQRGAMTLRWAMRLIGQARRQVLCRLRPAYVARTREERKGTCRRCGACCDLTFHCPFLSKEGPCSCYDHRPQTCRDFPIDSLDLRLTRAPCGHHFEER